MKNRILTTANILMPNETIDKEKWAVIACDQYTSQPEYWETISNTIGNAPSALNLVLPEIYLNKPDIKTHIEKIHHTMQEYLSNGTLQNLGEGLVLVSRQTNGKIRHGLVAAVDLECYDYNGTASEIRPTEKTVVERIPPRLAVRQGACLEMPHIMLLIDDPGKKIIEPLFDHLSDYQTIYDTNLLMRGGNLHGYFIPKGPKTDKIIESFDLLSNPEIFRQKYNLKKDYPILPFAVGDGNHSMATAKAYWEEIKKKLPSEEVQNHPARFALVEIVNIHESSLIVEPIHRVLFHVDSQDLFSSAEGFYSKHGCTFERMDVAPVQLPDAHYFPYFSATGIGVVKITNPAWSLPLATLQSFLDDYLASHPEVSIDYIHGSDTTVELATKGDNLGFLLPDIQKNDIFKGVICDGVLPRKTFSMGQAFEKRYYMEARKITK